MRTLTWEEIDKDWNGLQKRHRMEIAEAVARYCVGHKMEEVAEHFGFEVKWVKRQLAINGTIAATGGAPVGAPLEATRDEVNRVVRAFAPSVNVKVKSDGQGNQSVTAVEGDDADEFRPYLDHYLNEGQLPAAAIRLAKAEWAGEAAVEAGVIKESRDKQNKRVNKILFPEDDVDTWTLRFRSHMAAVERAAEFLDSPETKINYLRRKSTCEKVASAHAKWLEQVERVRNFHPDTFSKEV